MAFAHVRDSSHPGWTQHDVSSEDAADLAVYKPYVPTQREARNDLFSAAVRRIKLANYRYEVTFGLYVMTPAEKLLFNTILLACVALLVVALFVFLPRATVHLTKRTAFYYWGSSPAKSGISITTFREILDGTVAAGHALQNATAATGGTTTRLDL